MCNPRGDGHIIIRSRRHRLASRGGVPLSIDAFAAICGGSHWGIKETDGDIHGSAGKAHQRDITSDSGDQILCRFQVVIIIYVCVN